MSDGLPHDKIIPYKNDSGSKKKQVARMFDEISGGYDNLNRLLSARTDIGWRKKAIRKLKSGKPQHILDVATGTADMALLAWRMLNPQSISGIDISERMLEIGRKKIEKEGLVDKIRLIQGDAETIIFPDHSFDAVMVAFGVRNFENLEKGLAEMKRVLKPGGRLLVLEFSKPRRKAIRWFYNFYMGIVAPRVARWFKQNKDAYLYLKDSANAFPDRHLFTDILKKVGYTEAGFQPLTLGICCMYTGRKPE